MTRLKITPLKEKLLHVYELEEVKMNLLRESSTHADTLKDKMDFALELNKQVYRRLVELGKQGS